MADFSNIIQKINDDINTNGVGAITGAKLNEVLRDMIAAVNAEKQDPLTIDATPTDDSTNPVQSGGVYDAFEDKADKVSGATNGNLASFDANGNIQDSGIASSDVATTTDLAGKQDTISDLATIRSGAAAGTTAVQQVTVGTTTTGNAGTNASVTNSGTETNPVLDFTIPRGADAVNPFKGWYDSSSALPANPTVGDYAYVKGANASDPASIYECTTAGTWSDSGRTVDTSNVQTFASGEEVNEVGIDNIPIHGSDNVVKSGGVFAQNQSLQDSLHELNDKTASINEDDSNDDLNIGDGNGNVLVQFKNGHIKTKNFDSTLPDVVDIEEDNSDSSLDIGDNYGNVLVQFKNGHIKTKNFDSENIILPYKKTWITCAHRGNISNTTGLVENTLVAYYLAAEMGCNMIETDARACSDGTLVVCHDDTVTDVNGVTYTISNLTGAQATQIVLSNDSVYGVQYLPTLAEVLNLCYYKGIMCNIDMKNSATYAVQIATLVVNCGMKGRVYYATNSAPYTTLETIIAIDNGAKFIGSMSVYSDAFLGNLTNELKNRCFIYSYSPSDSITIRNRGVGVLLTNVTSSNVKTCLGYYPEILEYPHNVDFREIEDNVIINTKLY